MGFSHNNRGRNTSGTILCLQSLCRHVIGSCLGIQYGKIFSRLLSKAVDEVNTDADVLLLINIQV